MSSDSIGFSMDGARSFPDATYTKRFNWEEVRPGIVHTVYDIENWYFAKRLDLYAVVEPGRRALFIDTGWWEICGTEALDSLVAQYAIPWTNVEVFITHFHWDHAGNLEYCLKQGVQRVYHGPRVKIHDGFGEEVLRVEGAERAGLNTKDGRDVIVHILGAYGEVVNLPNQFMELKEGDELSFAGYDFEVVESPGHAAEHICLVERSEHFIFAGDHILDAPPGVLQMYPEQHLLTRYLASFSKIREMGLDTVYMSHHEPLLGKEAIVAFLDRIIKNHDRPLNKIMFLFENDDALTVYDICSRYYASNQGGFEAQSFLNQMRRLGTMLAYAEYLSDTNRLIRTERGDGAWEYKLP